MAKRQKVTQAQKERKKWDGYLDKISDGIAVGAGTQSFLGTDGMNAINGATGFNKLKVMVNAVTGKTTGLNMFNDVTKFNQNLNVNGAMNAYTMAAVATEIYARVPIKRLPFKREAQKVGRKLGLAGLLGVFGGVKK